MNVETKSDKKYLSLTRNTDFERRVSEAAEQAVMETMCERLKEIR